MLGFIAAEPERLADFLATTGLTPASVRTAAADAGFDRGLLSYLMSDENLLLLFAQSEKEDPAALAGTVNAVIHDAADDGS